MLEECTLCHKPLRLLDIKEVLWEEEFQVFIFGCQSCNSEIALRYPIFVNGHIDIRFLLVLKDNSCIPPPEVEKKIKAHFSTCKRCCSKFDELFLNEIETHFKFNDQALTLLGYKGKKLALSLGNDDVGIKDKKVEWFKYNDTVYQTNELLFHKDDFYYYDLRNDKNIIVGLATFRVGEQAILERLFLRSGDMIKMDVELLENFKKGTLELARLKELGLAL